MHSPHAGQRYTLRSQNATCISSRSSLTSALQFGQLGISGVRRGAIERHPGQRELNDVGQVNTMLRFCGNQLECSSNTAHPAANRACVNFICLHYAPWSRPCAAALANDVNWLRARTEAAAAQARSPASLTSTPSMNRHVAGTEAKPPPF
jgi:hypothetical protein